MVAIGVMQTTSYHFQHWDLILGDGSNVGQATRTMRNKNYLHATDEKWGIGS